MRTPFYFQICGFLALLLSQPAAFALTAEEIAKLPPAANRRIDFAHDVKPILDASCVKCHGRGRDKGKFNFDSVENLMKGGESGAPLVPGASAESILIELVAGIDPDYVM